ncbi:hypothetical protein P7H06_09135 [Paenibacillus larvae]|nr:hypothetical protein [Paenibacillus larvae]MDT2259648.1 hypothetical protein [Paenibacillus larvae]
MPSGFLGGDLERDRRVCDPIFETIGSIIQGVWDVISTVTSAV